MRIYHKGHFIRGRLKTERLILIEFERNSNLPFKYMLRYMVNSTELLIFLFNIYLHLYTRVYIGALAMPKEQNNVTALKIVCF